MQPGMAQQPLNRPLPHQRTRPCSRNIPRAVRTTYPNVRRRCVRHAPPGVRLSALVPQGQHLLEGGEQLVLDVAAWGMGTWFWGGGLSHVGCSSWHASCLVDLRGMRVRKSCKAGGWPVISDHMELLCLRGSFSGVVQRCRWHVGQEKLRRGERTWGQGCRLRVQAGAKGHSVVPWWTLCHGVRVHVALNDDSTSRWQSV